MTAIIENELELETILNKERDLRFKNTYNKICQKFGIKPNFDKELDDKASKLDIKEHLAKLRFKNICMSGNKCKNKFCMGDLVNIFNIREYIEPEQILCKECLEGLGSDCFLRRKYSINSKSVFIDLWL